MIATVPQPAALDPGPAAQRQCRRPLARRAAGGECGGDPEEGARGGRPLRRRPPRRRPGPGRGAAAHRCPSRIGARGADGRLHGELPDQHRRRGAAVAPGHRPRQGVHRGVPGGAAGRLPARRRQALARRPALGAGPARLLQGARRQVPAVPLQPLDPGAMARIPRALRVRADARLAARAAGVRGGQVLAAGRVPRAGVPEDAAADAARLGQLHRRPGRVDRRSSSRTGRRRWCWSRRRATAPAFSST